MYLLHVFNMYLKMYLAQPENFLIWRGFNTPLYSLNSVPLITMIEQKKFRASYEIHSNQDLEHNFLYIFFSITL